MLRHFTVTLHTQKTAKNKGSKDCTFLMSKKLPDRGRANKNVYDIEAQQKHLRRHLESLERDNHQPLDDVEGLVTVALAHIEDDNSGR